MQIDLRAYKSKNAQLGHSDHGIGQVTYIYDNVSMPTLHRSNG